MPNMPHCRFENTADDLRDCYLNMGDDVPNEYEAKARYRLIQLCVDIAMEYGDEVGRILTDYEEDEDY